MRSLRFIWRSILLIHHGINNLFLVLLSVIYMLILLSIYSFLRPKSGGYFVGIQEVCENIHSTKFALNSCGFDDVTSMAIVGHFDKEHAYDYIIQIPKWLNSYLNLKKYYTFYKTIFYLHKFLYEKEYFIFFWNRTFLTSNLDLILLKMLKKKVVLFHCGDDVRYRPIHNKLMEIQGVKYSFPDQKEAFSNLIFIQKLFYQKFPNYLNIPIYTLMDIETFLDRGAYHFRVCQKDFLEPDNKKNNDIPVIAHAPSHREIKGTQVVLDAIEILRDQKINFNFLLLENKPNNEVIEILKKVDIVIDQPGLWPGRLAMEAMAHSCIVFGGVAPSYENCNWNIPMLPFIKNASQLAEELKKILLSTNQQKYKSKSFEAYKSYYSSKEFVIQLNSVLSGNAPKELFPHPNHKEKLLDAAENSFQRFMIRVFVK